MPRPGLRFAAAGQQGSNGSLAGPSRGLSAWNRTPVSFGHRYAVNLAEGMKFYGDNIGDWGMGAIDVGPDLTFSSGGVPSQSRSGLAEIDLQELRGELGMPGQMTQLQDDFDVRMPFGKEGGLHGLGIWPKFDSMTSHGHPFNQLEGIVNPSDEYVRTAVSLGAWPASGAPAYTDLVASLPVDQQNTVQSLVSQGVQLVDAVYRASTGQTALTVTPTATESSLSSMLPLALLGVGAYFLLGRKGARRSRRRR